MLFKLSRFDLLSKRSYDYYKQLIAHMTLFKAFMDNSETLIGTLWAEL